MARDDSGKVLSDAVLKLMSDMKIDNGLTALGYSSSDIPDLVKATLPQVTCISFLLTSEMLLIG